MFNRVNYFIDRTIKHIRKVQDNMIFLEKNRDLIPFKIRKFELLRIGLKHDFSKFSKSMINGYITRTEYFYNLNNNLPTDNIDIETANKIADIHYRKERHHSNYKTDMSPLDICEMCCDIGAIAWENGEDDYTEYFLKTKIKNFPFLEKYKSEIVKLLLIIQDFDKKMRGKNELCK